MPGRKSQLADAIEPVLASPAMAAFDRTLRAVATKDVTVTFIGESGSGKEVMARLLHRLSPRMSGPFVPINCAAIPEALFESELFGHEKGSFTGATERAPGKVEAAAGGTLFLDEIAEMPLGLQSKLLRFLETHRYMRVGGTQKLQADVRLVLATLRPLEAEVLSGRFRDDLYYRIQGIRLVVPPLRERRRDIPPLIDGFLDELTALHRVQRPRLTRATRAAMLAYAWPGNVRELRNVVELLCILREGAVVQPQHLPFALDPAARSEQTVAIDGTLEEIVDRVYDLVLDREHGNLAAAARRLDVSVRTLQRRMLRRT